MRLPERIIVLNHFFCNGALLEHYTPDTAATPHFTVEKKSLRWVDLERYSNKQQGKMKMGGVIGSITFRGPLAPYLPVLRVGEHIHAGKGTSFGFGKYRIDNREYGKSALSL